MSTKYVIVKVDQSDEFQPILPEGITPLTVILDQNEQDKMLRTPILQDLASSGLVMNNESLDLQNFAMSVYTVDQTISRSVNGFQGWSRHLVVNFPVNDVVKWNAAKSLLEHYISFLSGDKWVFDFRQNAHVREFQSSAIKNPNGFTKICLLSGGLDSFIGAIDLLSDLGEKPVFVSHYKTGTEKGSQDKLLQALKQKFGAGRIASHQFYIQPNQKNKTAQKENSSRARSLLFICLGLTVANCLSEDIPLILPENGLISLNIPLTKTRLSSHSTRTTHPYFVEGLSEIIYALGINNKILNPYCFKTKGEMMQNCKDVAVLNQNVAETISCSHPEQSRYAGKRPGLNCGYCVPCIIRQAAEHKSGKILTEYAIGDVRKTPPSKKSKKGGDYRAFKLSLQNLRLMTQPHLLALQVNRSGP